MRSCGRPSPLPIFRLHHGRLDGRHVSAAMRPSGRPQPDLAGLWKSRAPSPASTQFLSNLATIERGVAPEIVNHYNVQPVFDVYANVDRRDLGSVASAVEKIVEKTRRKLPRGTTLMCAARSETMQTSFYRLGLGLIFAVILVYLLMAVNFQSWLDPFIILMALPGALAGIVWMLFVTQTTFSVPSLMGAIMCIGVATANSILMVVFANDERMEGMDRARGGALGRLYPHTAGADDGGGHDYRHAAHGSRLGRRRRTTRCSHPAGRG